MRILMIVDHLYPDVAGGTWNYTYEVAQQLVRRNHSVTVVTRKVGPTPDRENLGGMMVVRFERSNGNHLRSFLSRVKHVANELNTLLSELTVDLIVIQSVISGAGMLFSRRAMEIPLLVTFHGTGVKNETASTIRGLKTASLVKRPGFSPAEHLYLWGLNLVERLVLQRADAILLTSRHSAEILARCHSLPAKKDAIIPIGVDTGRFCPVEDTTAVRHRLGLPTNKKIILTVRRLIPRMGLSQLILAMKLVRDQHPDALLLIGGTGMLRPQLEEQIAALGLNGAAKLLGYLNDSELPHFYQAADLFVLPTSEWEGFGMVTLEALSSGLPVVGTRVGATPEVLGPLGSQWLAEGAEPKQLATAICGALERLPDTDRGALRQYAQEQFAWDVVLPRIEAFYEAVASR